MNMTKLFAAILGLIGGIGAVAGSTACVMFFIDEPECPKSMIEK